MIDEPFNSYDATCNRATVNQGKTKDDTFSCSVEPKPQCCCNCMNCDWDYVWSEVR